MTSDEKYYIIEEIKASMEHLEVSQAAAAEALGVSAKTVGNYLSGATYDEKNIRRLQTFLRDREFYRGYCFMTKEEFADLFTEIWYKLKDIKSTDELCERLRLTRSEANHIIEKKKSFDVRRQHEILEEFYEMCRNYTGEYIAGLEQYGEKLYEKLGLMFPYLIRCRFADTLNKALSGTYVTFDDIKAIAEKAGVSAEDIEELKSSNDVPFDIWKKCDILDAIRCLLNRDSSEKASKACINVNWLLIYYDGLRKSEDDLSFENDIHNYSIKNFRKNPLYIQKVILEHTDIFFYFPKYGTLFWDYIHKFRLPGELFPDECDDDYYISVSEFGYLSSIMELFRNLYDEDKDIIFNEMKKTFKMPFPEQSEQESDRYFNVVLQCFDMSAKADDIAAPKEEYASDVMKIPRVSANMWEYYHPDRANYMIGFDSREWLLWGMLEAAIYSFTDICPLIRKMVYMLEK